MARYARQAFSQNGEYEVGKSYKFVIQQTEEDGHFENYLTLFIYSHLYNGHIYEPEMNQIEALEYAANMMVAIAFRAGIRILLTDRYGAFNTVYCFKNQGNPLSQDIG